MNRHRARMRGLAPLAFALALGVVVLAFAMCVRTLPMAFRIPPSIPDIEAPLHMPFSVSPSLEEQLLTSDKFVVRIREASQ